MASRRKLKDQRKRERQNGTNARELQTFARRVQDALPPGGKLVVDAAGREKMSDVLEAFVEPYLDMVSSHEEQQRLYAVAVVAWNLALLPADEQKATLERRIATLMPDGSADDVQILRGLIEDLIAHKNLLFPANRRRIISFELTDRGNDDPYLQVVSTLK